MSEALEVLEHVSKIQDIMDLCDFMDDENFTLAMDRIVKIMTKPEIPFGKIGPLIISFTAWGNYFTAEAQTYMTIKKAKAGTDANYKKNIYFSMAKECHEMAAALKYMTRVYE